MSDRIQSMSAETLMFHMRSRKRRRSTLPPGELKRRLKIRWCEYKQRSANRAKQRREE